MQQNRATVSEKKTKNGLLCKRMKNTSTVMHIWILYIQVVGIHTVGALAQQIVENTDLIITLLNKSQSI